MAHETDRDYVSLDADDTVAVDAITRTTGVSKARVLGMLVRRGMGRPPNGAWETQFYRLIDEAARQFRSEETDDLPA